MITQQEIQNIQDEAKQLYIDIKSDVYNTIEGITGNKTIARLAASDVDKYLTAHGDTPEMIQAIVNDYSSAAEAKNYGVSVW